MTKVFALALVACIGAGCASKPEAPPPASTLGQDPSLPPSISGRWRYPPDGSSQVFSLHEIQTQPDKTFTARLTWWQSNPWCATRDLPIVGRQTEFGGIVFEVPRICGLTYLAELNRSGSGWVGKASSSGFGLYLDLKAD